MLISSHCRLTMCCVTQIQTNSLIRMQVASSRPLTHSIQTYYGECCANLGSRSLEMMFGSIGCGWYHFASIYIEWFVVMLVIRYADSMHVNCLLSASTHRILSLSLAPFYESGGKNLCLLCMGLALSSSSSKKKCHKHKAAQPTFHDIFGLKATCQPHGVRVSLLI